MGDTHNYGTYQYYGARHSIGHVSDSSTTFQGQNQIPNMPKSKARSSSRRTGKRKSAEGNQPLPEAAAV